MTTFASLSQRMQEYFDSDALSTDNADYTILIGFQKEVAGLEAQAQAVKEIADRARKLKAILAPKCKGITCSYPQMFDKYALDVVNAILEDEKNVAVGVEGEVRGA